MNLTHCCKYLLAVFISLILIAGCDREADKTGISTATQDLSIGRMRVSIWPEYDESSILAIYDGRFEDAASYPIKTSFLVPGGSVISDACSLSHEGQHFCQLYKTTHKGEYDEISLTLPYPNFYLSFHTPQFDASPEKRAFDYRIKTSHPVKTMKVDIQQPLRSTAFNISADKHAAKIDNDGTISIVEGFNHFTYALHNLSDGQESLFSLAYNKKDPKPSVDIKYTSMSGGQLATSTPYETQRNIKTFIYMLFGAGVMVLIALAIRLLRSRNKSRAN